MNRGIYSLFSPLYVILIKKMDNENIMRMMDDLLGNMEDLSEFFERLQSIQRPESQSKISDAVSQILNCLRTKDFDTYQSSSETILNGILPQKINNDRDLYRVYAKSTKSTPTVLKIDADISFLEAMSKFRVNFQLEDIVMLNLCHHHVAPIR